ncbi:MAG: phosphatase [Lachnospiraceae bacterium]|nr:phosphatase [Lachnospiraceae bacterium]
MRDILDVHTHTIASGHAYNTMMEMIRAAQDKGLEVYGITEHAPRMPGTCHDFYFHNLKVVERRHGDLEVLLGAELNILDEKGNVDLDEPYLGRMDVTIASLHTPCIAPGSRERNTECLIQAMKNPHVNVIGHPDDGRYPLDYAAVVQAAKEYHTLLEINNNSLTPGGSRRNARENDLELLRMCKRYQVPVILGSDAHYHKDILNHEFACALLQESDFPEELVVNTDKKKLYAYINKYAQ